MERAESKLGGLFRIQRPPQGRRALPGGDQSAFRAELYAAIRAAEKTVGDLIAKTDCELVAVSRHKHDKGKNRDLSARLAVERRSRNIVIKWIPAHLNAVQACLRGIDMRDVAGNNEADKEARKGLGAHVENDINHDKRMDCVGAIQRMQARITQKIMEEAPVELTGGKRARARRLAAGGLGTS